MTTKKYILKPGRHQFAPGSHAVHENENLSDEEAEWYLKQYPHISALFDKIPGDAEQSADTYTSACRVSGEEMKQSPNPGPVESPDKIGEIKNHQSVESKEI